MKPPGLLTSALAMLAFSALTGCYSMSPEGSDALDSGSIGARPPGYYSPDAATPGIRPEAAIMPIPEPVPRR